METHEVWIVIFLLVILKIPIAYLCAVIYYAIKAVPEPEEGAGVTVEFGPEGEDGGPRRSRLPRFPRPHGSPVRRYPRTPAPAAARMRADER
jgi:hypothetical protein